MRLSVVVTLVCVIIMVGASTKPIKPEHVREKRSILLAGLGLGALGLGAVGLGALGLGALGLKVVALKVAGLKAVGLGAAGLGAAGFAKGVGVGVIGARLASGYGSGRYRRHPYITKSYGYNGYGGQVQIRNYRSADTGYGSGYGYNNN